AIAETEDLDRVIFAVDERLSVLGRAVTDLTHVLAELTENAVRFSPPEANVTIRTRPYLRMPGAAVLTVEDWGIGMRPDDMTAANELLAHPQDVDLSMSHRLGLHVVARLAARHNIEVSLTPTPGTGVTVVVVLPADLFASNQRQPAPHEFARVDARPRIVAPVPTGRATPLTLSVPRSDIPTPRLSPTNGSNGHPHGTSGSNGRGLHARPEHEDARDWAGWWTPARQPTAQDFAVLPEFAALVQSAALPAPPPCQADAPAPVAIAGAAPRSAESTGLTRRIPQAHLAPELRRSPSSDGDGSESSSSGVVPHASPAPDAELAREALSRFQASRQAAQQQVNADDTSSPNGTGPAS
ncbi:MAG: ATP-binding protein, partial [Pseudonocardiaceae bacterium]